MTCFWKLDLEETPGSLIQCRWLEKADHPLWRHISFRNELETNRDFRCEPFLSSFRLAPEWCGVFRKRKWWDRRVNWHGDCMHHISAAKGKSPSSFHTSIWVTACWKWPWGISKGVAKLAKLVSDITRKWQVCWSMCDGPLISCKAISEVTDSKCKYGKVWPVFSCLSEDRKCAQNLKSAFTLKCPQSSNPH